MLRSSILLFLVFGCAKTQDIGSEASVEATFVEPETSTALETATPADGEWIHYGAEFEATETVSATDLLAAPQDHMDGIIRVVDARITDVCQTRGCWLVIAEGDQNMRVFTRDHAFVVDMGSAGSTCELEGTVVSEEVSTEFVEHLEAESVDVGSMPEAGLSEGDFIYEFVAVAIRIDGQPVAGMPVGEAPNATQDEVEEEAVDEAQVVE